MGAVLDFFRRFGGPEQAPVQLDATAYNRDVRDQQPRLSLQKLTAQDFITAASLFTQGNPAPMGRLADALLQTDPEVKAALKQLKTAVAGVEFVVTAPNDSAMALKMADDLRTDLKNPALALRALKGWIVEGRVRGIGLIEAVWNDPNAPHRTWERFVAIPQQRTRLNRVTGEPQFADSPYVMQGIDVSAYDMGKWIVVQPDMHIQDFALRGIVSALFGDWFGRLNTMGWWNMCLERDAMKTLVGKAASDRDAIALDVAFKNRGAAGAFLIRDEKSSVTQLEGTLSRSGVSPYAEYMTHTGQRIFLALLGESQTGIIEKQAGSKQSVDTQHKIARYVIEDICNDVSFIAGRDIFAPWAEINYGKQNRVNTPEWIPVFHEAVDVKALNEAIGTRPANASLGLTWYRQQTQWPAPKAGEQELAAPLPPPGSKPINEVTSPSSAPVGQKVGAA